MAITPEENAKLTQVGPGTPGGELMRRYWHPVGITAKLDENPVQSVRILGEDLVLYRDRSGRLGLIGRHCGHRLVDMVFGIPEERGLRCPYHGWCYDETGQCIETPLESPNSKLKDRVNIGGYPVKEMGGLVWGYLGPLPAPILPPWDFLVQPNAIRQMGITIIPCNWLQCHENSADPFHNTYLHGHFFKYQLERMNALTNRATDETTHRAYLSIHGTDAADGVAYERDDHGFKKGFKMSKAKGATEDGVRWFPYNIYPYFSRGAGGIRTQVNIRVPMDDTHTYHINYAVFHSPDIEAPKQESIPYYDAPMFDESGELILDYVQAQDMAAWWSQGDITDRSLEQLGATDLAIIEFRKIIEEQIVAVEEGRDPMNTFRDPDQIGECIELSPKIGSKISIGPRQGTDHAMTMDPISVSRTLFHKGYYKDEIDRYGPATPIAAEMMRAVDELQSKG